MEAIAIRCHDKDPVRGATLDRLDRLAADRFGVQAFRPGQRELIEAVLAGRDALGILPTGGGKSLTYELPALILDKPVVVVSPLIALMKDQCDHLARARVPMNAAELDSTLNAADERARAAEIRAGAHPIIYVTPERLRSEACIAMLAARGVGLLAVDEAHCVSQWGHDFRPAYLAIAAARERLGNPPLLALTATATAETANDIVETLGLRAPRIVRASLVRENLAFEVRRCVRELDKRVALVELLYGEPGPGIIYAATVKAADSLFRWVAALPANISVARYHAKMTPRDREDSRARFMNGTARVMVATKAFGMGIDKPDVRFVVHHQFPDSIESYYQEAGRAGRDARPARCVLLYRLEDRRLQQFFLARKYPARADVTKLLSAARSGAATIAALAAASAIGVRKATAIAMHLEQLGLVRVDGTQVSLASAIAGANTSEQDALERLTVATAARRTHDATKLDAMMHYAQSTTCRARTLVSYLGEPTPADCTRCDCCIAGAGEQRKTPE